MNDLDRITSVQLERSARSLAQWTVDRLLESDSRSTIDGDGRRLWTGAIETQIRFLAQAVAMNEPLVLADYLISIRNAPQLDRGMDHYVIDALTALRDVLAEEFATDAADGAAAIIDRALDAVDHPDEVFPPPPEAPADLRRLQLQYLERILSGERREGLDLLLDAVKNGAAIPDIYLHVLAASQREIGDLWHRGEISVGEEHTATNATERAMTTLLDMTSSERRQDATVVTCAVGGELHAVAVRMVADFFEMDGWRVIDLGGNMPAPDVALSLHDFEADLLAISITSSLWLRETADLITTIRGERDTPVLVGGRAIVRFPDVWRTLGADGFATTAAEAPRVARTLLEAPRPT